MGLKGRALWAASVQAQRPRAKLNLSSRPIVSWGSLFALLFLLLSLSKNAVAQPAVDHNDTDDALLSQPIELGEEYSDYKRGAGQKGRSSHSGHSTVHNVFMYLPNRLLDLVDIVKADLGIGPSYGGVIRVTRYGQIGYRQFDSWSLRLGLHGRQSPLFLEKVPESGFITNFHGTVQRRVDEFEIGAGADIGIAGAYLSVSPDQLVDFFGGIFGFDPLDDDL